MPESSPGLIDRLGSWAGPVLVIVGGLLAVSQVLTVRTSQGVFAVGVFLAIAGGLLVCDVAHEVSVRAREEDATDA